MFDLSSFDFQERLGAGGRDVGYYIRVPITKAGRRATKLSVTLSKQALDDARARIGDRVKVGVSRDMRAIALIPSGNGYAISKASGSTELSTVTAANTFGLAHGFSQTFSKEEVTTKNGGFIITGVKAEAWADTAANGGLGQSF